MYLPIVFQEKMKALLKDEWEDFLNSLNGEPLHGLRINTLKISVDDFLAVAPFKLKPILWSRDGFYIDKEERPGKHPYYAAGLYYIQEPSAMLPAEILNAQPGERVLDICAAPGGKSAQIAAHLKGKGLLVSNDINGERTKALARNLALLGVTNALILNESPQNLSKTFAEWFDAILVDAPCSGEGMFRRDEHAPKSWEDYGPDTCVVLQRDILTYVAKMLKPGGRMIYSTCTFSPEENEGMMTEFLKAHPEFEFLPIKKSFGLEGGRPEWIDENPQIINALRAWPHRIQGEGHFVALLRKKEATAKNGKKGHFTMPKDLQLWEEFKNIHLKKDFQGQYISFGEHLYLTYPELPDLSGLKIVRPGFYLGEFKKNRFEPSHALALSLKGSDVDLAYDFSPEDIQLERYFKGETIAADISNGWVLITVNNFGVGWGKAVDGILKNHYPKGWRRQ